jgi:AcrR family transcriptional regulator
VTDRPPDRRAGKKQAGAPDGNTLEKNAAVRKNRSAGLSAGRYAYGAGMLDSTAQNLAQLEPEGLAAEGQGWQQRKSAQTRIAILEAAVDCLQRYGYAATTTQLIAQTADISRGAMLHHYATKQDLIAAVIDYTLYKRMELFLARIRSLSEKQRVLDHAGIELYWESLLTREFTAFVELSDASRSDAELRDIFLPKARRYDRVERQAVLAAFPEWKDKMDLFELAMDFCIAGMEGILRNREIWDDRARKVRLRAFISHVILLLRDGALSAEGTIVKRRRK